MRAQVVGRGVCGEGAARSKPDSRQHFGVGLPPELAADAIGDSALAVYDLDVAKPMPISGVNAGARVRRSG